ncbi:MAG: hypothetical protein Q8S00_26355 [Deltaproteobacteria bacterium]|nr:hypothetical protein [Deltaproteobacteria bacterium]
MRGRTLCAVVSQRSRCNGDPNKSTITIHEHEFYRDPELSTMLKPLRALGLRLRATVADAEGERVPGSRVRIHSDPSHD